jgi:Amt family ammonium transporter
MNPASINLALILPLILLTPLTSAGLALIHQGLGRSRSAAHAMLATLCSLAVAAIFFTLIGNHWAGYPSGPSHTLQIAATQWNWLGSLPLASSANSANPASSAANALPALSLVLQVFTVGLAAIIPLSAGTDRWRLAPICVATAVFSAFVYPLMAHWAWASGWLSQLAANFHLASFQDFGGAAVIQVPGGLMALSVAWILGPRRGKYSAGQATAIPGHNIVQVLFGCLLALIGFIALESAASLLFSNSTPEQIPALILNAILSASAGCLAAVLTTQIRYRKPDASISANGWVAGLVAGSAGCQWVSPPAAILIGSIAGLLTTYLVEILELRLLVDDPGGAISVHAASGLWGLLAFSIFTIQPGNSHLNHILAQLIGIATLVGIFLPLIHGANLLINRFLPYRTDRDGDWQGMDIRELGSGAYPEFVIHADEFVPR